MISLQDVSLTLAGPEGRPVHILQNIDLQVQAGETVSIVGPSGSGKTSLMMLIAGVEQATSGQIAVANTNITRLSEDELAAFRRAHVGVVFQNFHLIPTMTALENVSVALELAGVAEPQARAAEGLEAIGLGHRLHHYPEQLSGGEQQRTALVRAYITRPHVLLADEPTGNLDSENGQHIVELLFKLCEEHGTTLLLITHDKELAKQTKRQIHIQDGQIKDNELRETH